MKVENVEVALNELIYLKGKTASGNYKFYASTVVDINEHVKAIKVSYSETKTKTVRKWHPISSFVRTIPITEEAKKNL